MALKFTDAIKEITESEGTVERHEDAVTDSRSSHFLDYLKAHAPELIGVVTADLDKNFTAGDVHVPAAGGEDPKKKKKKPNVNVGDRVSVSYLHSKDARKDAEFRRSQGDEPLTFDSAGSSDSAFDYWVNKLKLKHSVKLEADPAELKQLTEMLNTNPVLRAGLLQALNASVGKAGALRTIRMVRHGATHLNNQDTSVDRIRGQVDVPLSDEGREEAQKVADKMAKDPPDHIVSSDLSRAHDTAKYIAAACDMKIDQVSKGFRPWDVGVYAGMTSKEAVPILCQFAMEHPDQPVPKGESFNSFRSRFFNALADAVDSYPGVLAVVTHHRGERLISAWAAAGFPADGTIDGKEFSKKGEATAGTEDIEIPVDRLKSAAAANVAKWVNKPKDYSKIWQSDEPVDVTYVAPTRDVDKSMTLNVLKVDAEKQIFYGWAYVSEENGKILVDKQDDYIEPADLLAAAEDFTLQGGKLGDMHDQRNVGRVVASFVTTKELCDTFGIKCASDRRGWILGFKVDDPQVWSKIKGGAQLELSIGGKGERIPQAG